MKRLIHSDSRIFFPNPHVVRLEFSNHTENTVESEFYKIKRSAYKLLKGTWGHSKIITEIIQIKNDFNHSAPPGAGHFSGMNNAQVLASLFNPDWKQLPAAYICFADELDELQFRLSVPCISKKVIIWPDTGFTIHEVIETDES